MKILISPSVVLTLDFHNNFLLKKINLFLQKNLSSKLTMVNGEMNHYGDMISLLGSKNIFFLDVIHESYYAKKNQSFKNLYERYPSSFFFKKPNFIKIKEIYNQNINFDFYLVSSQSKKENFELINFLKKKNTKIGLFDKQDDNHIYLNHDSFFKKYNINDFDIIFKQDVPLNLNCQKIIPIAPVPCKINISKTNQKIEKNFITTFVGDYRKNVTRFDRVDIINFFEKYFIKDCFFHFNKDNYLQRAKLSSLLHNSTINLSPSGKVWDSYRHCELVNYGKPILLPVPDCKTADGKFIDMKNCIFYETKIINNKHYVINKNLLLKKINEFLLNDKLRLSMYSNYYSLISNHHTTIKRALYIKNNIEKLFKS